jgi:hypothetical protein
MANYGLRGGAPQIFFLRSLLIVATETHPDQNNDQDDERDIKCGFLCPAHPRVPRRAAIFQPRLNRVLPKQTYKFVSRSYARPLVRWPRHFKTKLLRIGCRSQIVSWGITHAVASRSHYFFNGGIVTFVPNHNMPWYTSLKSAPV